MFVQYNSSNSNYFITINFKQFISIFFLILNVSTKRHLTKFRSTKSNSITICSLKCRLISINFCSQNHYEFESTLHEKSKSNRRSFMNLLWIKSNITYESSWLSMSMSINVRHDRVLTTIQRSKNWCKTFEKIWQKNKSYA